MQIGTYLDDPWVDRFVQGGERSREASSPGRSVTSSITSIDAGEKPPRELVVGFWTLVILVKLAVIVVGAGAIVIVFTEHDAAGLALFLLGGFILVRWVLTYRRLQAGGKNT